MLAVLAACLAIGSSPVASSETMPGPLFLIQDQTQARVVISWPTRAGGVKRFEAERPYASAEDRTPIGGNLACFVAMGGTRLDKGFGHPDGAVVRVGFYKIENSCLLFEDLADNAAISIELRGMRFTREPAPRQDTIMQHLKYLPEDVEACGLGDSTSDLWNVYSTTDSLGGKLTDANSRFGSFRGPELLEPDRDQGPASDPGYVHAWRESDGSVSLIARIPYRSFRHFRDPWLSTVPGAFLEPNHFHVELEILPSDVPDPSATGAPLHDAGKPGLGAGSPD